MGHKADPDESEQHHGPSSGLGDARYCTNRSGAGVSYIKSERHVDRRTTTSAVRGAIWTGIGSCCAEGNQPRCIGDGELQASPRGTTALVRSRRLNRPRKVSKTVLHIASRTKTHKLWSAGIDRNRKASPDGIEDKCLEAIAAMKLARRNIDVDQEPSRAFTRRVARDCDRAIVRGPTAAAAIVERQIVCEVNGRSLNRRRS